MNPACCPIALKTNPQCPAPGENCGQAQHVMYAETPETPPQQSRLFLAAIHLHLYRFG
jgi:hypothetical protein